MVAVAGTKDFSSEYFGKIKGTIVKEVINEDTGEKSTGWKSYKKVCDLEGQLLVDELLKYKKLDTQRHPKLPAEGTLAFPHDRQIWYEKEKFKTINIGRTTLRVEAELDDEASAMVADIASAVDGMHGATQAPASSPGPSTPRSRVSTPIGDGRAVPDTFVEMKKKMETAEWTEKLAAAKVSASKFHAEWDRTTRSWNGTLRKAEANPNTKGTEPTKTLASLLSQGADHDQYLLSFELGLNTGGIVSTKDIDMLKTKTDSLYTITKQGSKVAAAITGILRL